MEKERGAHREGGGKHIERKHKNDNEKEKQI